MSNTAETKTLLMRYIKARIPLITVKTDERQRAIDILTSIATDDMKDQRFFCHMKSRGMFNLASPIASEDVRDAYSAFDYVRDKMRCRERLNFILTEAGDVTCETGETKELLDLVQTAVETVTCIILVTGKDVWPLVQQMGLVINLDKPDELEAYGIVRGLIESYRRDINVEWDDADCHEAASALAGVSKIEIENTIVSLIASGEVRKDDLYEIRRSKDRLFSNISGLEKIPVREQDSVVGGLFALQEWCRRKKNLLTPEKRDELVGRGLKPPRGILLVGVPGCGKSLSAKSIAASWKLPLYRLDFATVQGSYVGQSERQLKEAFSMAEAVSPCILWIDEIEKGLSGAGTDSTGVSTRMVGQFLFWLQECSKMVFVVATANDVSKLPPELLRRGRFDEIFFVDLPSEEERRSILSLYMEKYLSFTLSGPFAEELVEITEGFSGADLESAARDLGYMRVEDPDTPLTMDLIRKVFNNVIPLSQSSPEQIAGIQDWGRERAVPASGKPIGINAPQRSAGQRVREVII